jgi:hypothetical protein
MKDNGIRKAIASDDYLKGKNIDALFKLTPAKPIIRTKYDIIARPSISQAFVQAMQGKTDIPTALRGAEEKANQAIAAQTK